MRRITALFLAGILSLSLTATALADTINETLSVQASLTVTGIPASIAYGSLAPGATSAEQSFLVDVTSNSTWQLDITGTDFARTGGGTLGKGARQLKISNAPFVTLQNGLVIDTWTAFDSPTSLGQAGLTDISGNSGQVNFNAAQRVVIPAAQQAGAYTGTTTYAFSTP